MRLGDGRAARLSEDFFRGDSVTQFIQPRHLLFHNRLWHLRLGCDGLDPIQMLRQVLPGRAALEPAAQDAPTPRLPEPPFVQPAAEEQRQLNYWLMDKRVVTLPFNLFSSGFALAVYALFFLLSDLGHWQVGFFRTLGQNALAAYILHEIIGNAVGAYAPHDAPLWWVATTFVLYVGITYLFVRHLEKNGVFLRM